MNKSFGGIMTCRPDHVMMGMSAETFWPRPGMHCVAAA